MKLREDNGLISALTELIKSGATTATDIAHATFHAIANCADTAIFTSVTPERAFREAEASSKRILEGRSLGVLDVIPVAWKDLYDLKGMVTRAGSRILDQGPALVDAELVRRLTDAGAVTVGKLNMTEFAFSGLGLNPHYGTPRNPWDRKEPHIPGGGGFIRVWSRRSATVPIVAPLLVLLENDDEAFAATNALMLRNTMIGSFLNWCGVAIPSGFDATGLPTSVLFSGGPGDDSQLLLATIAMEPLVRSSSYH